MGASVRHAGSGDSPRPAPDRLLARALGAHAKVWLVPAADVATCVEMLGLDAGDVVAPLSGRPIAMHDVRALARQRAAAGTPLVVDLTLTTFFGCAATRLGADVSLAPVGEGGEAASLVAVGLSRDAGQGAHGCAGLAARLDARATRRCAPTADTLHALDARRRAAGDAAQAVASYLCCHPCVGEVRYLGLKTDPSFPVASSQLTGGFGPLVDFRLRNEDGWRRIIAVPENAKFQVMDLERKLAREWAHA